ncbi:type I restriction-modification system subunit M [Falsiroseomonas bella]|uniref:type I restriction-modification system subunit M n=1 Tax=Falsiroseomonas bella TaxID=2184016 RepID=UPI001E584153|nr:class I SAM-dependent DNA methyltransferase [Falsiroseomonas bella]
MGRRDRGTAVDGREAGIGPGRGARGAWSWAAGGRGAPPVSQSTTSLSGLIWSVADLLRGDYQPYEYGKVILPFTVLRRLDCVLAPTKEKVLAEKAAREKQKVNPEPFLLRISDQKFVNTSPLDLKKLMGDQDHLATNLTAYIQGFSESVRDIFERFRFADQIDRLKKANLLYKVTEKFAGFDLGPDKVSNRDMGLMFEELIRKFADHSNQQAAEQFTPRDAIKLMVNLLFIEDSDILTPGNPVVRTIYDPTAGTGGMLSDAEEYLRQHNPKASLTLFGQELNDESYAICKADMLIKGQDVRNIVAGNTLSDDGHAGRKFDYMLSNPPFGVDWKKIEKEVRREHEQQGYAGRFGPGLPRIGDGAMLFLLHLVSKMRPAQDGGSRFGIVLNGSPLFTGGAGSGESEIRRYILENDLLEAIVALPTDMFFNTGIATYVWIVSNKKTGTRKGKVQLIDGSALWQKMRKSLGSKRKEMSETHITMVTEIFGAFVEAQIATVTDADGKVTQVVVREGEKPPIAPTNGSVRLSPFSRIFSSDAFGYRSITVERPQRDARGHVIVGQKGKGKGKPVPDPELRDTEMVPLGEDIDSHMAREVLPHAPDAWMDEEKTRIGYEIPFNRFFYVFEPPRSLAEIDADLKQATSRILAMLERLAA